MRTRSLINKIKIITLAGLVGITLNACAGTSLSEIFSGYAETINNRVDANLEALDKLYSVGLLSKEMHDDIANQMKSRLAALNSSEFPDDVKKAVSYVAGQEKDNKEAIEDKPSTDGSGVTKDTKISFFHSNYSTIRKLALDAVTPYELMANKSEIDNLLKTNIATLDLQKGTTLAEVLASVKKIKELQDSTATADLEKMYQSQDYINAVNTLTNCTSDSGVSLLEGNSQSLFRVTEHNDAANLDEDYNWDPDGNGDYILKPHDPPSESEVNDPYDGKDLIIFCEEFPAVSMRLSEFDFNTVDSIIDEVQGAKDSYLIFKPDSGKAVKILRLVYPVSYISSLTNDNGTVKINVEQSKYISMNILTGQLILNEESNRLTADERRNLENIINLSGIYDSGTDSNQSAVVAWDRATVTMKDHNGADRDYQTSTVLLTDYLEYTYMPGLMSNGEDFVALGRKLKIVTKDDNISADGKVKDPNNFAYFVDRKGKKIDAAGMVSVSDFIDYRSGDSLYPDTKIKLSYDKPDGINTITVDDGVAAFGTGSNGNMIVPDAYATDSGGIWAKDLVKNKWFYTLSDGSKTVSFKWYLIDNGAGTFHYFYFDGDGFMKESCSQTGDVNGKPNGARFSINADGYACDESTGNVIVITNNQISNVNAGNTSTIDDTNSIGNGTGSGALGIDSDTEGFTVTAFADTIYPFTTFPLFDDANGIYVAREDGTYIGTADSTEVFYGACIDKNIFSSQLYSGWINSEDSDVGNVTWWNNWLDTAKFNYHIDLEALKEYLGFNFAAELYDEDSQTIVLNPQTIAAIQQNMDDDYRVKVAGFMRSLMVVFGYLAYAEALLLLAAWAVDIFFSFGIKFTPLVTFKKCEAISDDDEYPNYNNEEVKYLNFKGVLIRAISLVAIGVVLSSLDVLFILGKIMASVKLFVDFIFGILFNK